MGFSLLALWIIRRDLNGLNNDNMFLKLPPTDNSLLPIYLYFDHEKAPEKKHVKSTV